MIIAAWRALWWKLRGREVIVPSDVHDERLVECENGCEWFDPMDRQCLDCTCFVDLKVWVAGESCPRGKWDVYRKHLAKKHE
jgi:hypothetical protein